MQCYINEITFNELTKASENKMTAKRGGIILNLFKESQTKLLNQPV